MDVGIDLVLAPVNGSDESETAVEYALALADRYGADLHLVHVLKERVVRGLDAGDVAASSLAADFLVIPREPPRTDPGETLGKAALYVLEYASQPVLSV